MSRRRTIWSKLSAIQPWHLLVLALISGVVCIAALRANNEHMGKLRDAVYAADVNNGDVQKALNDLQAYVTAHMNTSLSAGRNTAYPPIQLKYTYERLQKAQTDSLAQKNTQLYTEAQHYCEAQNSTDFSGRNRVPCIEQYVRSHNSAALPAIPDALYKFDFVSPSWSPDLAGWSLVCTITLLALAAIRFVSPRLLS